MNLATKKTGAVVALFCLLIVSPAFAANQVHVTVTQERAPVEGVLVEVYGSAGMVSAVTDAEGVIAVEIVG